MSPFPFPTLKIIFIIFFPFRLSSAHNLTAQQINRALEDIPFDSDNSDMYEVPTPSTGPVHCTASAAKEPPFHQGQGVGVAKEEFVTKARSTCLQAL